MSFVQREIDRLNSELASEPERRAELYAAQQALAWSLEPNGFQSPYDMIKGGTQANSEGCAAEPHPAQFSNRGAPNEQR
jgi:hypothetical protein